MMRPWGHRRGGIPLRDRGFPFLIASRTTPITRLRALGAREGDLASPPLRRWIVRAARLAIWPWASLSMAWRLAAPAKGRSRMAAFFSMARAAILLNVPPVQYRRYVGRRPEARRELAHYLFPADVAAFVALNRRLGADHRDVEDKYRFAEICARHSLPHIRTLAAFRAGEMLCDPADLADAEEVFVKPLGGHAGKDVALWRREGAGFRRVDSGSEPGAAVADATALLVRLRGTDCIAQPRVKDCVAIGEQGHGVSSLRIVTARTPGGAVAVIFATLLIGAANSHVSQGGLVCSVDLDTGRLDRAYAGKTGPLTTVLPGGARITGFPLPWWEESLALVRGAHAGAFHRFATLGWDLALTASGPVLMEANTGWGMSPYQVLRGPIGHTALSEVLGHYFAD